MRQRSLNLLELVINIFLSLCIWVLKLSFKLLSCLRMMDGTSDFEKEAWVHSVTIDTSGSFSLPRQFKVLHWTRISLDGIGAIVQE